ncbi:delayed-early response protein/equilibrative nucleoside transporter [Rhizobium sp. Root274]|uniref:nickel/cobalt transporter n=1 Tax=unclassified Rhizobium TaxID=2613769 RepID=UPI000713FFE6|nr:MULTISPECIES: nickel/cobalt transporter [unclassified Rhizobium]KQW29392.1 delayed-early response protein/equilibrative nucleoside transporter [Rhizobium sp. Root1240]KRD29584.1 delayed-early response protein/equilibrative nucleoside transporter [Rhizobium sp. Root274]
MLSGIRTTKALPLLLALGALLLASSLAHAASPLGVGAAEPSYQPMSGPFAHLLVWINTHQQAFYRSLTTALKAMREDPSALATLIGLSFAYGVFHAAGPGHGKAVISSYMLANEIELKRGILVAFVSALLQALVAIAVVGAAYFVLRGTAITMTVATQALETASYAMIVVFGVWLLVRKLKVSFASSLRGPQTASPLFDGAAAAAGQPGITASLFAATEEQAGTPTLRPAQTSRFRADAIDHGHDALAPGSVCHECGITHVPDPAMLRMNAFGLRDAWSAVIAVGLRPCSGALLVMTFALLNGLVLGGVLSVLAMALGTAITVSALASLAVGAKGLALRLSGPGSRRAGMVASGIEIGAAVLVILLGALLLVASLQA